MASLAAYFTKSCIGYKTNTNRVKNFLSLDVFQLCFKSLNFPRGSLIALSIKELLFIKKLTAKLNARSNSIRATVLLSGLQF